MQPNQGIRQGIAGRVGLPVAAALTLFAAPTVLQAFEPSVTLGGGMRASFNSIENAADDGSRSKDFDLNSVRLYVNGGLTDKIGFTFNTEYDEADNSVEVMDAIARFEWSDLVNIWAGRHLPPSDRSNLSGPYYLSTWNFPAVQAYPAIFAGRDNGVTYWGQYGEGMTKWQIGVFEGPDQPDDDPLIAGRVTMNFWDPEPGYYNASTYFGDKDVLAIGLVAQGQGSDTAYSIDALMETGIGTGTMTLEGAYYWYDGLGGLGGDKSNGYFALAGYLFPATGPGQFQPVVRYAKGDIDNGPDGEVVDFGINYIMRGHNARVSLNYQRNQDSLFGEDDVVTLGVQLQI